MPALATDAIVLHAFDYLETSRILKLLTRQGGVQSVLARGARRSRARYGSALDLFAQGSAEIHVKPNRDLQTLSGMDITRSRSELAEDMGRFTGASMLAEFVLRFVGEDSDAGAEIFDCVSDALDVIARAPGEFALEAALAGTWHLVSTLGLAPAIDVCAACHANVVFDAAVGFSHPAGGALCDRCARSIPRSRNLPPTARAALREWLSGNRAAPMDEGEGRAHQRLLREFVQEHLGDNRPLRAFSIWEHAHWGKS